MWLLLVRSLSGPLIVDVFLRCLGSSSSPQGSVEMLGGVSLGFEVGLYSFPRKSMVLDPEGKDSWGAPGRPQFLRPCSVVDVGPLLCAGASQNIGTFILPEGMSFLLSQGELALLPWEESLSP